MDMENTYIRFHGEMVDLYTYRTDIEAIDAYNRWFNDEDINMWIAHNNKVAYITEENIKNFHEWFGNNEYAFNIQSKSGTLIGHCAILLQPNSRNGLINILIGEQSYRDKGIGTSVMKMLIKYCFEELNLHNVILKVKADNRRAIKVYNKVGFKICGTERERAFYKGKWCDVHTMQILEQEYYKLNS